ncbi:MAG: CoA-binding protein [Gemmatimonadaceae bacterium]|nr:CoA-binding protein [Gemmatimonadaceae bacterium]MCU0627152.1 CoA-binding protein [Gemmatimonadaceae bacterium]
MTTPDAEAWRAHLLTDRKAIHAALARQHRIAVVGIKPAESGAPAFYVPEYAQQAGFEIVPVPTYYPEVTEILGRPVHRSLRDVPGPIDVVQLFRRPADIPPHVDDILAVKPTLVWMQLGIRHDESAERLARAGIDVVQDHCMLVELRAMGR